MKILILDCEHSYGIMRPWEHGFYLSCVSAYDNRGWSKTWWFDHSDYDGYKRPAPDFNVNFKEIQDAIDTADIIGGHNLKHDASILTTMGRIQIPPHKMHCTQLTEFILSGQNRERAYSLNAVAEGYGLELKDEAVRSYWDRGIQTYDIPSDILGPYCEKDCEITLRCCERQLELYDTLGVTHIAKLDNEFTYTCMEIENNGFKWDLDKSAAIRAQFITLVNESADKIHDILGDNRINISSNTQMSPIVYGRGMVDVTVKWNEWTVRECKTKPYSFYSDKEFKETIKVKGLEFKDEFNGSIDKNAIKQLKCHTREQREFKEMIRVYNKNKKVCNTLLNKKGDKGLDTKIQSDGKIHPHINQTVARTGRLTSSDPNSQNLPRDGTSPVKECIIPTLDGLLQWDLSQIEWRGACYMSQDVKGISEIRKGVDAHGDNCVKIMCLPLNKENRTDAKIFLFRMIYGGQAYGFYMDTTMPNFSLERWGQIYKDFYTKYSDLKAWHVDLVVHVMRHGTYHLPTGRWFQYHKSLYKGGEYVFNERQIKNYPVQGIAGDILKLATVVIMRGVRKQKLAVNILLTVHDSLVFEYKEKDLDKLITLCNKVTKALPSYIKTYFGFDWNVPLDGDIEIGYNYGELYKLDKLESLCPIIPKPEEEE
jgi:DNA polymerase I-like protein with 3'-5' exonuclease and polymerase domains